MLRIVLFSTLLAPLLFAGATDAADFSFRADAKQPQTLDVLRDGKPLMRYMGARGTSSEEQAHATYKVYCHVIDPTGAAPITKGPGGKFTHHRGVFIGWNRIKSGDRSFDLWHMRNGAAQLHKEFVEQEVSDDGATLTARIDWVTGDGAVLMTELRRMTIRDDADAHLALDFSATLTAAGDLTLDGDPEHAGMQYRPSNEVAQNTSARYLFPADDVDPHKDVDLPWAALNYKLGEDLYSVQHMNRPDNPKGTRYSAYRDYGRFGAFPKIELKQGEPITLTYGIRVTLGDMPSRDALHKTHEEFVKRTAK